MGVGASLLTELITLLNKKLNGTTLQGNGALLVSAIVAIVGAGAYEFFVQHLPFSWESLSAVWAVSQAWFLIVAQNVGLTVQK